MVYLRLFYIFFLSLLMTNRDCLLNINHTLIIAYSWPLHYVHWNGIMAIHKVKLETYIWYHKQHDTIHATSNMIIQYWLTWRNLIFHISWYGVWANNHYLLLSPCTTRDTVLLSTTDYSSNLLLSYLKQTKYYFTSKKAY